MANTNQSPSYTGHGFPDGPNNTHVTLGRHNKWGYLTLIGPNALGKAQQYSMGLMETFEVTEENGTTYDPQASGNWLELNIGTPMWRGSGARSHVRGGSLKELLFNIYGQFQSKATGQTPDVGSGPIDLSNELNLALCPFIWSYDFNYAPPFIAFANTYESARWQYHKIVVVRHTQRFITGPNQRIREDFDFIGAGENFNQSGSMVYQSDRTVWEADYYNMRAPQAANNTQPTTGGNP